MITSGQYTNFNISPCYSFHKSLYHKTHVLEPIYVPWTLNTENLHPAGWPILFCRPTQEPVLATGNTGKNQERFRKKAGDWTKRVEISKEESPAVSVARMAIHWPTPGFKGKTFKLCVLTRWDFDFCVRSSPLRGYYSVENRSFNTADHQWIRHCMI